MTDPTVRDLTEVLEQHLVILADLRAFLARHKHGQWATAVYLMERELTSYLHGLGDDTQPRGIIVR